MKCHAFLVVVCALALHHVRSDDEDDPYNDADDEDLSADYADEEELWGSATTKGREKKWSVHDEKVDGALRDAYTDAGGPPQGGGGPSGHGAAWTPTDDELIAMGMGDLVAKRREMAGETGEDDISGSDRAAKKGKRRSQCQLCRMTMDYIENELNLKDLRQTDEVDAYLRESCNEMKGWVAEDVQEWCQKNVADDHLTVGGLLKMVTSNFRESICALHKKVCPKEVKDKTKHWRSFRFQRRKEKGALECLQAADARGELQSQYCTKELGNHARRLAEHEQDLIDHPPEKKDRAHRHPDAFDEGWHPLDDWFRPSSTFFRACESDMHGSCMEWVTIEEDEALDGPQEKPQAKKKKKRRRKKKKGKKKKGKKKKKK